MHRTDSGHWWLECFQCGRTTTGLRLPLGNRPSKGHDMGSTLDTDAARLVQAEYLEMPGLHLTMEQAQRLWNFDRPTCERTLTALVERRFLSCTPAGKYVWTGRSAPLLGSDLRHGLRAGGSRGRG